MTDRFRIIIFLTMVISIAASLHFYLWARLIRDTSLPTTWRRVGTVAVVTLVVALLGSLFARRMIPIGASRSFLLPIYIWMGMMFLMFLGLLSGDIVRLLLKLVSLVQTSETRAVADPERRIFLARTIGGVATTAAVAATLFGTRRALALSNVVTEKVDVPLTRLPRALDGFRIVQLSDLHIGPTLGKEWLEGIVHRANKLEPDIIVITGDLVDGDVETLRPEVAPLAKLAAKQGVFFCTGNHEYYSGAVSWCAEVQRLGIRVLRNERVSIGNGEASFDLAGVDDYSAKGMAPGHGPDLQRALAGRDQSRELVLLAHQPRHIHQAAEAGVGLQLSGHTHGGQIWPWHYLIYLQQPYVSGLVNHQGTMLYVSQGTGFWGPPIRIGSRCEISQITLRSKR
jgi:predicted MPP superfamily phosphohydrolase